MMLTREDIAAHVRPQIEQLVEEIVDRAWAQVQRTIDEVLDAARSSLESDIEIRQGGETVDAAALEPLPNNRRAEVAAASPSVSVGRAGSSPAPDTSVEIVRAPGRTNTCRNCGAVGFTSRTCGKTHNVAGASTASSPAKPRAQVVEAPPPYSLCPSWRHRTARHPDGRRRWIAARSCSPSAN